MMRLLFCALCFLILSPLPLPLSTLNLPARLVAVANALLGMLNIDFASSHVPCALLSLFVCLLLNPPPPPVLGSVAAVVDALRYT
jgi:hypothetical protein